MATIVVQDAIRLTSTSFQSVVPPNARGARLLCVMSVIELYGFCDSMETGLWVQVTFRSTISFRYMCERLEWLDYMATRHSITHKHWIIARTQATQWPGFRTPHQSNLQRHVVSSSSGTLEVSKGGLWVTLATKKSTFQLKMLYQSLGSGLKHHLVFLH